MEFKLGKSLLFLTMNKTPCFYHNFFNERAFKSLFIAVLRRLFYFFILMEDLIGFIFLKHVHGGSQRKNKNAQNGL